MSIMLDHTIVPARDRLEAAAFFAHLLGLRFDGPDGPFAPVRINESLTFDFDEAEEVVAHHYGFLVPPEMFDEILDRVKAAGVSFGSGPEAGYDGELYHAYGREGFYFPDPNGHVYEVITCRSGLSAEITS
jgi:catechol 2,3-dioxygenase-like lactoylglutathione lyase family enzyme